MRQVVIDKEDMHYVVTVPSFFSLCMHATTALPLLERGVFDDLLFRGWKICTGFPTEL
jgi:hypothetical protein